MSVRLIDGRARKASGCRGGQELDTSVVRPRARTAWEARRVEPGRRSSSRPGARRAARSVPLRLRAVRAARCAAGGGWRSGERGSRPGAGHKAEKVTSVGTKAAAGGCVDKQFAGSRERRAGAPSSTAPRRSAAPGAPSRVKCTCGPGRGPRSRGALRIGGCRGVCADRDTREPLEALQQASRGSARPSDTWCAPDATRRAGQCARSRCPAGGSLPGRPSGSSRRKSPATSAQLDRR